MIWPFSTIERLRIANRTLTAHHIAASTSLNAADAARRLLLASYDRVAHDLDALTPPVIRIGDPAHADALSISGDE